jgi:hypothetical protein
MGDFADDRVRELTRLHREGRRQELYGAALTLVGELEASEGRRLYPEGERHGDLGSFWERAPVWARAMELALRGESTGLSEFLTRVPSPAGFAGHLRRDVELALNTMLSHRGSGELYHRIAAENRTLSALVQAGDVARAELDYRVVLSLCLAQWLVRLEAAGVDLSPHADCLFPDDYVPSPHVGARAPEAAPGPTVTENLSRGYVETLRAALTSSSEALSAWGELRGSQAALRDALQAQVNASKAEKPPAYDARFALPLPADCEAHSGPECGWLVTWYEDGARKTAILPAQWDREHWSRKMATWVPLRDGLPCTWPVGGAPPQPYHVQHREEVKRLQDLARDAEKRVDIWRDVAEGRKKGEEALEKQTQQLLKRLAERDEVIGKLVDTFPWRSPSLT